MRLSNILMLVLVLWAVPAFAQEEGREPKVPEEVKPFIERDMKAIALKPADLNGDGRSDFLVVLDTTKEDEEAGEADRPVLVLVRGANGKLTLAARNDAVVYCRECGGVFGDPFDSITVTRRGGGFIVANVGGSSDRWLENYEFAYSRLDKTWQLVRATFTTYNVFKPKRVKTKILTPKNFGKVNFADFSLDAVQKK